MLTNNINEINDYIEKAHKYASIVYNKMIIERYGIKPCKSCGDTDNIGIFNIHIIEYEKIKLNELLEGECNNNCHERKKEPCKPICCYNNTIN